MPQFVIVYVLETDARTGGARLRATGISHLTVNSTWADCVKTLMIHQLVHAREWAAEDRNTAADRVRDVRYREHATQMGVQVEKTLRAGSGWGRKLTYGVDASSTKVSNLNDGVTPASGETFPLKRFPDTRETVGRR